MPNDKYKEKIDQAVERLEQGIKDFFHSDHYRDYLQVMGKFHRYSVRNCILIASQRPDAGRVAGYNDWKKNFNRQVKKGEKGIMILAPYKRTIEVTLAGKYDSNGDPLKEKRVIFLRDWGGSLRVETISKLMNLKTTMMASIDIIRLSASSTARLIDSSEMAYESNLDRWQKRSVAERKRF